MSLPPTVASIVTTTVAPVGLYDWVVGQRPAG